ncbi:hypothetical protein BGX27_002312 [Mortierella sp. AM989]|nr:hypothetical protein BGX27_002312 [Mortierella sp. AM989]
MHLSRIDLAAYAASLLIFASCKSSFVHAQPQPVGGAAFARVGNNFYIQGGAISADNLLSSLWALDLTKSWTTAKPAWTSLSLGPSNGYHSAAYSADNKSFITFGRNTGADAAVVPRSWVNIYDIPSGTWSFESNPTGLADNSRRDFSAVTNPNANKIYIIGGGSGVSGGTYNNVFDTFDPAMRTLTEITTPVPGPQGIMTHSAVWVSHLNAMIVLGGSLKSGSPQGLYLYHPHTGAWTTQATTGSYNYAKISACAASNADGSLVAVFGGFDDVPGVGDPHVFILDTTTWAWTTTTYNGRGRGHAACAIADDTFLIWGGFFSAPNTVNGVPSGTEALLLFSLSTKTWQTTYTPSAALAGASNPTTGGGNGTGGGGNGSNSSNGNNTTNNSEGLSTGAIGGIAAGSVAVIIVLALAVLDQRRKKKRRDAKSLEAKTMSDFDQEHPQPDMTEHHHQVASPRPPPPKPIGHFQSHRPFEALLGPRPSTEGRNSTSGYSNPTTPTTLQFSPSDNGSGSDFYQSRQSYPGDYTSSSTYYPIPPPPLIQKQLIPEEAPYDSPHESDSARRFHDPHSVIIPEGYYPYTSISTVATGISPVASTDQYHDTYGMKHTSIISLQSGHSNTSSTFPQAAVYDPRLSSPAPPIPKRPVSGPHGIYGFGSAVEQPGAGAPQAILQHQRPINQSQPYLPNW